MANTKISALPLYTGNTDGTYLVMDNSALTDTYKVTKETFLAGVIAPVVGSWTLGLGNNFVSFTVAPGNSYIMWVNGNIPNGIVSWTATVTITNTNVPVVGVQVGWYYVAGNQLVLTSIPSQIVGNVQGISTSSPAVSNTNTFNFVINNNSGASQIINYGYIKIS